MLLSKSLTQLNIYDIARFGCTDFAAAESLPQSPGFAAGQGAGLWTRRFGSGDEFEAVMGSEAMRIYQLATFTRGDGVETLVGLGVRTADLFSGDYPLPQRWALKVPNPLVIFYSEDGATWQEYSLGAIERGEGDASPAAYFGNGEEDGILDKPDSVQNALMNSTAQWRSGLNEAGVPCLWTCSGTHLIEWDGFDARVTPLGQRATALALSNGRFYLSAGSRTSITGVDGVLAFTDIGVTSLGAPKMGDARIVVVAPGTNLIRLRDRAGEVPHEVQAVGYVGGQWLILAAKEWMRRVNRGETTTQELAVILLSKLPTEPLEIETHNLQYVHLENPQEYFDLGRVGPPLEGPYPPDPIAIRRASGRAYIFQRRDLQDAGGWGSISDMERETTPLLEMLCNPSLADFDMTAALEYSEGHIVGTADGYILAARLTQNRVSFLARLDGKVLRLLKNGGQFYALTPGALWVSGNGTTWEVLREANAGHSWRDAILTTGGRLFAVSNGADSGGGPNTRVAIYDNGGAFVREDLHATKVRDVLCEYSGVVYAFGTDAGGGYHRYDESNAVTTGSATILQAEDVTTATADAETLYLGTASGKLLAYDGDWNEIEDTARPIGVLTLLGDSVLIGFTDSGGEFGEWDGDGLEVHQLNAPCATDARVFLDDGTVFTDAGPVFPNPIGEGEAFWFSKPRTIEPGEMWDEALAAPLAADGSILTARAFVGPADAGGDLAQYQPLEPGVRCRLLRPLASLRFAVVHPVNEIHKQYEFVAYRKPYDD